MSPHANPPIESQRRSPEDHAPAGAAFEMLAALLLTASLLLVLMLAGRPALSRIGGWMHGELQAACGPGRAAPIDAAALLCSTLASQRAGAMIATASGR